MLPSNFGVNQLTFKLDALKSFDKALRIYQSTGRNVLKDIKFNHHHHARLKIS
jgi:hypothetical protein